MKLNGFVLFLLITWLVIFIINYNNNKLKKIYKQKTNKFVYMKTSKIYVKDGVIN